MPRSPEAQAIYDQLIETEYKKPFSEEKPFAALVAAMGEEQKTRYQVPTFVSDAVTVTENPLSDIARIFTLTPADGVVRCDTQALFFHGGAFLINIMDTQWRLAITLVERMGCTVHMLEYPLAPTYGHHETYQAMQDAYRWALERAGADHLVLLGDSVGAHMVIACAQFALNEGLPQPARIVAMSPWIDFGNFLPGKSEREAGDPIIGMVSLYGIPRAWCGDAAQEHVAPPNLQYGPFEGMAPVYIQIGSTETLMEDALELKRLIEEAKGQVKFEIGDGLWHTYALYPDMPEGAAAVQNIIDYITLS